MMGGGVVGAPPQPWAVGRATEGVAYQEEEGTSERRTSGTSGERGGCQKELHIGGGRRRQGHALPLSCDGSHDRVSFLASLSDGQT
jgi:hypothetical protein